MGFWVWASVILRTSIFDEDITKKGKGSFRDGNLCAIQGTDVRVESPGK